MQLELPALHGVRHQFRIQLCTALMSGKVDDDLSMQLEAAPGDMFSFVRISWCEGDAEGLVDNDAAFARAAAAAASAEAIDDPAFRDPTTRCARVTSFKGNLRDAKKYFELVFLRKTGSNWKGATHCYAEVPAARRGTLRYRVAGAVATSGATAASGATFSSTAALMPYSLLQSWAKKRGIKANATLAVLRAAWVAAMEGGVGSEREMVLRWRYRLSKDGSVVDELILPARGKRKMMKKNIR